MKLQLTKQQPLPTKPDTCDNCAGVAHEEGLPIPAARKDVRRYNIFPHGVFSLCPDCAEVMAQ